MSEKTVPVVLPDGTPGTAPAPVAKQIVAEGGRQMSAQEAATIQAQIAREEKYDPLKHPLNAAGSLYGGAYASWLSGVTGGLSDIAIAKGGDALGVDARGFINDFREQHPLIHGAESMAGFAGSAAVGGEALGGGIGAAETGLGRVAQGAVRGGVEMGLYEGGKAAADAALANEDITAQKVYAGAKHGVVAGLIGGAAFSALGEGVSAGRSAIARGLERDVAEAAPKKGGGLLADIGQKAADSRDAHMIKALGGSAGDIRALNATVEGGYGRVAQDVRGVVREYTGKIAPSREEMQEAITKGLDDLTAKRSSMLSRIDEAGAGFAPDPKAVAQRIEQEFIRPNLQPNGLPIFGAEKEVATAAGVIKRLEQGFGDKPPTFTEWAKALTRFREDINYAKAANDPTHGTLKQIGGILRGELETAGEDAAKSLGESFADSYNANQKLIQSLLKAQSMVERGVAREVANNSLGLTSRMAGVVGAGAGLLHGGPLGLAGGIASAAAGKVLQDHGDMLAVELLDRVAGALGARRIAQQTDAVIESGVKGLLGKAANDNGAGAARRVRAGSSRQRFDAIEKQITQLRGNPAALTDRVARSIGTVTDRAPRLTDAMTRTAQRAFTYLSQNLPASRSDQYALQPQLQKSRVSDAEVSRFMRKVDAVDNPTMVLKEAKAGTLTRDHVEAVKAVYPDLYEQMRSEVMRQVIDTKHPLSYQRKIQLGILLDIPTDRTLAPDFVRAIQATYSASEPAGEEPPHPNLTQLDVASSLATATQSATQEGTER